MQERKPIFEGCPLTVEESDVLIMSHAIHQSTDAEIEDLIKLINCHLPAPVNPTKYVL